MRPPRHTRDHTRRAAGGENFRRRRDLMPATVLPDVSRCNSRIRDKLTTPAGTETTRPTAGTIPIGKTDRVQIWRDASLPPKHFLHPSRAEAGEAEPTFATLDERVRPSPKTLQYKPDVERGKSTGHSRARSGPRTTALHCMVNHAGEARKYQLNCFCIGRPLCWALDACRVRKRRRL